MHAGPCSNSSPSPPFLKWYPFSTQPLSPAPPDPLTHHFSTLHRALGGWPLCLQGQAPRPLASIQQRTGRILEGGRGQEARALIPGLALSLQGGCRPLAPQWPQPQLLAEGSHLGFSPGSSNCSLPSLSLTQVWLPMLCSPIPGPHPWR